MEPTVSSKAMIISTPFIYDPDIPFTKIGIPQIKTPERGDIVVCQPAFYKNNPWYIKIIDTFVKFFTIQKKDFGKDSNKWIDSYMVKRVIGLPGDTIKVNKNEVLIKPKDRDFFFNEKDLIQTKYNLNLHQFANINDRNLPLSNMQEITLGENEYFVVGDNRPMSNDSSYWGAVNIENIKAKVLFEYSPEFKKLQ